ncbi:unnamed protein product [Adineta steineri]|uniref:Beta-lactamase-related domain-containing protein n=1 Tax=Adineta steineri TaxID=433720 RepID=A0A813WYM9_9BILA|nr:unnamed protein product [Adineta steineri]
MSSSSVSDGILKIATQYSIYSGSIIIGLGFIEILKEATKSNTPPGEIDSVFNVTSVLAMGFFLLDRTLPSLGPGVFGHSGAGGSIGFAAPAKQLSFAYVMNRLELDASTEVDPRYKQYTCGNTATGGASGDQYNGCEGYSQCCQGNTSSGSLILAQCSDISTSNSPSS